MPATTRLEIHSPEHDERRIMFRLEELPGTPLFLRQNPGSEQAFRRDPENKEES